MPPASFKDDDSRKAFYEKYNKKVMEKYYNDPEFRKKLLDARNALHKKQKELGIGMYSPEAIARDKEYKKAWYQRKKAEKLAEKLEEKLVVDNL